MRSRASSEPFAVVKTEQRSELVLASASPRRRDLLGQMGIRFRVVESGVDEGSAGVAAPEAYARVTAERKAGAISGRLASEGDAAFVLGAVRLRFWWWPLHPVGYMLANLSWGMNRHYLQFFVGWAAKTNVLRWGGLRLYRRTMPIAVGVIVGDQVNSALWGLASVTLKRWL